MGTALKMFIIISLTLGNFCCFAVEGNNHALGETEIRKTISEFTDAFNLRDPNKIASLWAKDGELYHPTTGQTSEGREEIKVYYQQLFTNNPDLEIELTVDNVNFDNENQPFEQGTIKISFKNKPKYQGALKFVFVKEEGRWLIQRITDIAIESASSNYVHLKELDWLIGDWIDHDDNIDITFNCKWDKHKNFLTQKFSTKILNQDQLEGRQIIAWDPIKEKIRSWVFDSDGGFGEGYWKNVENSWYGEMSYTLTDGKKASATLIYTKVDNNSYIFSSVGRDVDGNILPDIDPVTVFRVSEAK